MPRYAVTIPIAGHAHVEVDAANEKEAKEKAFGMDTEDIEWEMLTRFNSGNVCYCPDPWSIEAEEIESEDE